MLVCPKCQATYQAAPNYCGQCGTDLRRASPIAAPLLPDAWLGRVIDRRYRILEKIGHGGMGAVYRVEHLAMGKLAAMKMLHEELLTDRHAPVRFRREAEAISQLTHPNTVQIFDFGHADGVLYLVMELVRGQDLGAILRRDGALDFARAAPIASQVCASLAEAHDLGIIHRDLKPDNLIISRTKDGRDFVKVLDFGLARIRERAEPSGSVTAQGEVVGTPYYMSPEQIRSHGEPDARSDIYSLGAVLYRMLTGDPPFQAESPIGVLTKHLTDTPVPLRQRRPDLAIPHDAERIALRALAKRPEDRYQTVDELRADLDQAHAALTPPPVAVGHRALEPDNHRGREPTGVSARELGTTPEHAPRMTRSDFDRFERSLRRKRYVGFLALPALVAAIGATVFVVGRQRSRAAEPAGIEAEPNNSPGQANLIASGQPVRGKIGQRLSREQGDQDVYRIPAEPGPARLLRASTTGLPNIDLVLEVFDAQGELVTRADEAGTGEGERLANVRISAGEVYVVVREVRTVGHVPIENVTDEYALDASWRELSPRDEAEPNDSPSQAMRLEPGAEVTGYLDHRGDVDWFTCAPGACASPRQGELRLPRSVAARVTIGEAPGHDVGEEKRWVFELAQGQLLRLERLDPPTQGADKPPLSGLDDPYRIVLK